MRRPSLPYLLLLPVLIYLFFFLFFPFLFDIYYSTFNYNLAYVGMSYIGGANYQQMFSDANFWMAFTATIMFAVACIVLEFLLGLGLALYCARDFRGVGAMRIIMLVPMMMIPVATGIMWKLMMFQDNMLNYLERVMGLPVVPWLGSRFWTPIGVVIMDVWQWTPFIAIILLAGLMGLPLEPFEAARVDGARALTVFRRLTLPMLYPAISVALILRVLDLLKLFDAPYVMSGGGSGTETLSIYVYREGFSVLNIGYSSAVAVVFFVFVWVLANIIATRMRRVYE
jgi:multiple sugar transport system permease protein